MKIIDILNKKAKGTLEDAFKFSYNDEVYTYDKEKNRIFRGNNILNRQLGDDYVLEKHLNDKILLFQEEVKEKEEVQENKEIEEMKKALNKLNETFDKAYNELIKENKEE